MGWYKILSGLPQDARLAVVVRRTGLRRGEVLAIWVALLDHACTARPRGCVKNVETEELAAALGFDPAAVETVLAALRDRKMISPEDMICGWDKHQKLSTPRTRAHRARAAAGETDDARRQRLQLEINTRHKKRGLTFAKGEMTHDYR